MGGGGGAGQVSWPSYIQDVHSDWLNETGAITIDLSVTGAMNGAFGNSPFTGITAFNPDSNLASSGTAVTNLSIFIQALNSLTDYTTFFNTLDDVISPFTDIGLPETFESSVSIQDEIQTFSDILEDQLESEALPAFKAGMLNIGALSSSSFQIGEAILRGFKARDVARYGAELGFRVALQADELKVRYAAVRVQYQAIRNELLRSAVAEAMSANLRKGELLNQLAATTIEHNRIAIVAQKEELESQLSIDSNDRTWDLEVFQFGSNVMAGISGGVGPISKGPSRTASVLGGALSGAAVGATVGASTGNPYGVLIGAVAGAALGAGAAASA